MRKTNCILTAAISLMLTAGISAQTHTRKTETPASDCRIEYTGRTWTDGQNVSYDWSGVYFRVRFDGPYLAMKCSDTKNTWLNIWVDSEMTAEAGRKTVVGAKDTLIVLAEGLGRGTHEVIVQKRTEGEQGRLTIHSFLSDGELIQAKGRKERHIEFIGDSYTCGYGTESNSRNDPFLAETENCNLTYAAIAARYFNADFNLVSHSGQGIARNYDNAGKGYHMSDRYSQTFDLSKDQIWEASKAAFTPDIVVIYLGTNDFSCGEQPAEASFRQNYIRLLKNVKANYGEDIPVLCMGSPADPYLYDYIRNAVTSSGLKKVEFMTISGAAYNHEEDLGASWHPNYQGQRKVASCVIPYISTMTGWEMNYDSTADLLSGSVKDIEGKGIAGVSVSDGLNVAQTDSNGEFAFEADKDSRFVFISTPSGYISSTLDGETIFYKEIEGTDKRYDFVLRKNPQEDTDHNLIVIADPQISERDELPELEKHVEDIAGYVKEGMDGDYTFGLCLGDIVGWDHSIYPEYNRVMSRTGFEFRHVIGNHDMTNWGRSYETSMKNYGDTFGPAWYSFNVGKVHYVVLNDNFYVGRDYFYIGYIDERQLSWLEKDLASVPAGSTVVVSMHIPTTLDKSDRDAFKYGVIGDNLCNKPALYRMLEPYKTIILSGHMHTADFEQISDNIIEINVAGLCGAWWCGEVCIDGSPAGFKAFEMNGDDVKWIYKGCGHPDDYQMKVYTGLDDYPGQIIVNVWDYDPLWKVEYYEDGRKVCDMERFKALDPLAKDIYKDPASLKRQWVYAAPTENMFKASISPAARKLEVRITDRFGRTYTKKIKN